MTDYWNKEI